MLKYGRLSTGDTMVQLQIIALLRQAFIVFNSAGDDVKWLQPNAGWWGSKSHEYFTEYYCIFKGIKKSIICVELRCQPIKLCHHTTDRIGLSKVIGSIDCWGQSKMVLLMLTPNLNTNWKYIFKILPFSLEINSNFIS